MNLAQYRISMRAQTIHADEPEPAHPNLQGTRFLHRVETFGTEQERVAVAGIKWALRDPEANTDPLTVIADPQFRGNLPWIDAYCA